MGCMHTKSKCTGTSSTKEACFLCGKLPGNIGIHEVATFQVNEHEYACVVLLEDSELLAKLDMVALEAKYHTKCLVDLYNRA